MKNREIMVMLMMLLAITTSGQMNQSVPERTIREIADRNARSTYGDVYPSEAIPYYGFDDEIIAWRYNYSIGKPFPTQEQWLSECLTSEEQGDKHSQWGAGKFCRLLVGARKTVPVMIEKSESLSPEYAEAPRMERMLQKAFDGQPARLIRVYYFNHFDTWYEYESDGVKKYLNLSPTGGILDQDRFLEKKQAATWFIQPDDFSRDWEKYEKGFAGNTDELKVIPNLGWMPYYDWSYGCTPTAGAMLLSWWDYNSYNTDYKYSGFVNRHYQRWDNIETETDYNVSDLQLHLALAMGTDTLDGSTWPHLMDNGYIYVCNDERPYDFSIGSYYTMWWTHVTDEIDAGRPVHIDISGHTVCGVGYDDDEDLVLTRYTWDPENTYINRYTMLHIVTVHPGGSTGDAVALLHPFGDARYNRDGQGERAYEGDYYEIKWRADKYYSTTSVDLFYSTDGGYNYNVIALGVTNSGFYHWNVPTGVASNACRVMIYLQDTEFEPYIAATDGSYGNFIIQAGGSVPELIDGDVSTSENETDFYRFTENSTSWVTVAALPQDPECGWGCELWDENFETQLAASTTWTTGNFVVLDGNHLPLDTYGVKVKPQSCRTACDVQYENSDETITLTPGATVQLNWGDDDLIEMRDIHLVPGQYFFEMYRISGEMDLDMALFGSSGGNYYQTLDNAMATSTNNGSVSESFMVTIGTEDDYGICFFAKESGSGMYAVRIEDAFIWRGYESTDWHDPENWSGHTVPGLTSKVVIPSVTNDPEISNGNAFCGELDLMRNALLTITDHNLIVNSDLNNNGEINISSSTSTVTVQGDVLISTYGSLSMIASSGIYVYGDWTFGEGSSAHINSGFVNFQGNANSLIYVKSDNSWFYDLKISKTDDAWVAYDNCPGIEPLRIKNQFVIYDDAAFIQYAMYDIIFEGPFLSYAGSHYYFQYGTVRFDRSGSGGINIYSESGSYFNNVVVSVTDWLGLSSDIEIRGDLLLEEGMFQTQGYDVYIKGDWNNNAGFDHDNSRVIFNGTGIQEVTATNFWELELNKPLGELRVRESTVSVQHYDWTQGTLRVNGGYLQLNDLDDPGIYGTVILTSGRLDYRQDPGEYLDLNGNLQISGGEMNIIGGNGDSYWPFSANAAFTMSDGILDFNTNGLRIHNSATYSLTENITGGLIRLYGDLTVARNDFNATGGTIYFYGYTEDATLSVATGSNLFNLEVDKSSKKSKALAKTLTASGTLDLNGDFIITGGNFEAPATMYIGGLFINNQTAAHFDEFTGEVILDGSCDQQFNQDETFYRLTINKPGDGHVTVSSEVVFTVLNTLLVDKGSIIFNPGCSLLLDGNFDINYLGNIYFYGESGNEITVTSASKTMYGFDVSAGGFISANNTVFSNMDVDGIYLHSGCYVDSENAFNECSFNNGAPGGTLITWDNGADVVVHNAVFPENLTGCTFNVKKTTNNGHVFFDAATGPFSGAAFESDPFSRIAWEYVPPINLPFTENWTSASYTTNHWVPEGANWTISEALGNPAPCATFHFYPRLYNYTVPLRSHLLNGTDFTGIHLKYDIRLVNYSTTTLEQLKVQVVQENGDFITLATYNNAAGTFGFLTAEFDISGFADGELFYLRFTAFGADSWNLDDWLIDNIIISGIPPEPGKLSGFIMDDITGMPLAGAIVSLDGTSYSAVSQTNGEYTISNITPGIYNATVTDSGYEPSGFVGISIVSGETTIQDFNLTPIPPAYCTETLYITGCIEGDGINNFTLGTINNIGSGCSPGGYGDFTGMSATLSRGCPYALTLSSNFSNQRVSVWIDWNDDFSFSITERVITDFYLPDPSQVYTAALIVPEYATPGIHRLRARTNWSASCSDPCATYSYGEAEDYSVEIVETTALVDIVVTVTDDISKAPVPDARIELAGTTWIGFTEEEGICILNYVIPGPYDVIVTAINYEDLLLSGQMFWAGETGYLDIVLIPLTPLTHTVSLEKGWQGLSSYVMPLDVSIADIFAPVLPELIIVQNMDQMYWPEQQVNTLQTWKHHSGYKIKMAGDAVLPLTGYAESDKSCILNEGWSILPVVCTENVMVAELFGTGSAADDVIIVKEIAGTGVYWPELEINTLVFVKPGSAYLVLMANEGSVTFPENPVKYSSTHFIPDFPDDSPWLYPERTPVSHLVAIPFNALACTGAAESDILGVFTEEGICCGVTSVQENTVLTAFADDPLTFVKDGLLPGERMYFRICSQDKQSDMQVVFDFEESSGLTGGFFMNDGVSIVSGIKSMSGGVSGISLFLPEIYPNPVNNVLNIKGIPINSCLVLEDLNGKILLKEWVMEQDVQLHLEGYTRGVYMLRIISPQGTLVRKIVAC